MTGTSYILSWTAHCNDPRDRHNTQAGSKRTRSRRSPSAGYNALVDEHPEELPLQQQPAVTRSVIAPGKRAPYDLRLFALTALYTGMSCSQKRDFLESSSFPRSRALGTAYEEMVPEDGAGDGAGTGQARAAQDVRLGREKA